MRTRPLVTELSFTGKRVHSEDSGSSADSSALVFPPSEDDPVPDTGQQAQVGLNRSPSPPTIPDHLPEPAPENYLGMYRLSHYCLQGIMASGRNVYSGAVAADSIHKLGDKLFVQELGIVIVEDRFAEDYRAKRLDIWVSSCSYAIQMGVKYAEVSSIE